VVRVTVQPVQGQQVREVAVAVPNAGEGLVALVSPTSVTATIAGPQPTLLRLTGSDLQAAVDVAGLPAGTHAVPVTIQAPEGIRVDRVTPERVNVTLTPTG
jgi:YbbR domain-containing protein